MLGFVSGPPDTGDDVPDSYDSVGCEDPTVAYSNGKYYLYDRGWNEHIKRGELLLASGPTLFRIRR